MTAFAFRTVRWAIFWALLPAALPATAQVTNGDFATGDFSGWEADPNWVVVDNSCGYYAGWGGKYWAWSGATGEAAVGVLKSRPFVLDKPAVRMLVSGWGSMWGTGQPRHWNYITLNLEDGTEIDRVWAPDTTNFMPVFLDGSRYRGRKVRIEAVDDADQPTFSMLCIDEVRTADLPAEYTQPAPVLPAFDPARRVVLEDDSYRVEVDRANGSLTRLRDKRGRLELIAEPRLAGSFVFSLPIPGKEPWQTLEANWVRGREQRLSSWSLTGKQLTLRWNGPLRNYLGEAYKAAATMTIELTDAGVVFGMHIQNGTTYPVGETYFPVLGGFRAWAVRAASSRPPNSCGRSAQSRRVSPPPPYSRCSLTPHPSATKVRSSTTRTRGTSPRRGWLSRPLAWGAAYSSGPMTPSTARWWRAWCCAHPVRAPPAMMGTGRGPRSCAGCRWGWSYPSWIP